MTDLDRRRPEFTIALRGYDRSQVDEYIAYLQRLVADAEERVREAETEYVFDEHAAVGPRIAEMFALAEAEARDLRTRVSQETGEMLADARKEARKILESAERAAREMNLRTERDQEAITAEFERERDRIRDEAVELEVRKAEAIGELRRLRDVLGEASGAVARAAEQGAANPALPAGSAAAASGKPEMAEGSATRGRSARTEAPAKAEAPGKRETPQRTEALTKREGPPNPEASAKREGPPDSEAPTKPEARARPGAPASSAKGSNRELESPSEGVTVELPAVAADRRKR